MAITAYWGRKFGGFYDKAKGPIVKGKRGSNTGTSNSKIVPAHYTALLVANAMAYGWLNGKRIRKDAAHA